jgi:hypothetical protein
VSRYRSAAADEIGYWRRWYELNEWMVELAKSKLPPGSEDPDRWCGYASVLLTTEDLQSLKLEMLFGDLIQGSQGFFWSEKAKAEFTETALGVVDKAIRVCKHGRSLVYYLASW